MDIEFVLEGLLPGGATGAISALSTMEARSKRTPRLTHAPAAKEWPPVCESGICRTQGCICRRPVRTLSSSAVASSLATIEFSAAFSIDEFGSMFGSAPKASKPQASPTHTIVKRGRSRPPKRNRLPTKQSLVEAATASLRTESLSPFGRMALKKIQPLLASSFRRATKRSSHKLKLECLLCYESLDDVDLFCYEPGV